MQVVEVETQEHQKRYVVIDNAGLLVEPIMRFLNYLDRIGAARNTIRAYATVLKQYWEYLSQQQLDWQQITLDDLARFVL
jgi:integrase/recombinase XerD